MYFDPENPIVKLCALGMEKEGLNLHEEARQAFQQAWTEAGNNFEKYIASHYVARRQKTTQEKLNWDKKSLEFALLIEGDEIKGSLPSLYLNIAKGYEDLGHLKKAEQNYVQALSFEKFLLPDGYGQLILSGIQAGLKRVTEQSTKDQNET
ncbi:MAG: rRNA adenine methyltransferase [Bacteroidia bacterium]|nr:rRNA adenine methyltransferase [Bacteroidia bacterium]